MGLSINVGAYDDQMFLTFMERSQNGLISTLTQASLVSAIPIKIYLAESYWQEVLEFLGLVEESEETYKTYTFEQE